MSCPVVLNYVDENYITDFVLQWSLKYPIDKWWRDKYKVSFNSPQHRVLSFIDLRFEYEEDLLFHREERDYKPNTGNWLKEDNRVDQDASLTDSEKMEKYKREFKSMDLSQYTQQ